MFKARRNAITGQLEWMFISENEKDDSLANEIALSTYGDMLHDSDRNSKYCEAIKLSIEKLKAEGKKVHCVDIGTGTGLLTLFALKNGADFVTAFESFEPMYKLASQTLLDNMADQSKYEIIGKCSKDVEKKSFRCGLPVNIIVAEIFDTELIGEGCLSTFLHAKKEFAADCDCIFIPNMAQVFAVPFQSEFLQSMVNPGQTVSEMLGGYALKLNSCRGLRSPLEIQFQDVEAQFLKDGFKILSEPVEVFTFDFREAHSFVLNGKSERKVSCKSSGSLNAVMFYWTLQMCEDRPDLAISTCPFSEEKPCKLWREHWMQAVYPANKELQINANELFSLSAYHDEYSFWFTVSSQSDLEARATGSDGDGVGCGNEVEVDHPGCTCGIHVCLNRSRMFLSHDRNYFCKFTAALTQCDKWNSKSVLLLGNFNLLLNAVANCGPREITILEDNFLCLKTMAKIVSERPERHKIMLKRDSEDISSDIDLVVAEPYFMSTELPWHSVFLLASLISKVRQRAPRRVGSIPSKARLLCAFGNTKHLHKLRALVENEVHGVSLRAFNDIVSSIRNEYGALVESHRLFQYETSVFTPPIEVKVFDFEEERVDEDWGFDLDLEECLPEGFDTSKLNCLFFWMEYQLCVHKSCHFDRFDCVISEGFYKTANCDAVGGKVSWNPAYKQAVSFLNPKTTKLIIIKYIASANDLCLYVIEK